MNRLVSPEARQVLTFGRERYWGFRVAEGFGPLKEETYQNGWWYLPTDSTQITKASKRIEAIKNSGVRVRQVIIAHEAPKLLCGPKAAPKVNKGKTTLWVVIGLLSAVGVVTAAVAALVMAAVTVAIALFSLLAPLAIGAAFVMMLGLGVLVDPCAIVVLEDGTRIEVMTWVE